MIDLRICRILLFGVTKWLKLGDKETRGKLCDIFSPGEVQD